MSHAELSGFIGAAAVGLLAASLCAWIGTPLPWLIGPLFSVAGMRMAGMPLYCPQAARCAGQWAIGTALGLYFTPAIVAVLLSYLGFIAIGVAYALLLGLLCAWLLQRLSGVDRGTAFFSMAVGGASEMAVLSERHGARVDRVAAAHGLRIMMVVAIIPFAFQFADVPGSDPFLPGSARVDYLGLLLLIGVTLAMCALFAALKLPNAWVLGPMLAAGMLTAVQVDLSAMPRWMVNLGQLCIGLSLGTRFSPEFLRAAPRFMASVATCTLFAIGLSVGFAWLLSDWSGMHFATAVLATSPGGIAEMSLTAKTLELGVPIVTAFHVTRLAVLVLTIGPLYRLLLGSRTRQ